MWVLRSIGPQAAPALVKALQNDDEKVRQPAIQAIVERQVPVTQDVWLEAIRDSNQFVQIYAARELAKSKDPIAVDALCTALQDEDMDVRIEVAKSLGKIGDARAIGPLIEGLPDDKVNANVEIAVGKALGAIGAPAVSVLLKRFDAFDECGKRMAHTAIRSADALQASDVLQECLKSEYGQVRGAAVSALANLNTSETRRVVFKAVEDPDWHVRSTAARLLGEAAKDGPADEIRSILLKMVEDDVDARVRERALWTLYFFPNIPTEDYLAIVDEALRDESPLVRAMAATSCAKFPDARFWPRLIELLNDVDASVRADSASALGGGHVTDAIPKLIRRLDDEDQRCASYAAIALARIGADEAVAPLIARLRNTTLDDKQRELAIHALCFTANPMAIEPLTAALKDRSLSRHHLQIKNALKKHGED